MSELSEDHAEGWPLRPWMMAGIGTVAGLLFYFLTHHDFQQPLATWRQAGATFVAIGTLSFLITAERQRFLWACAFAVGAGIVLALVGWFTAGYNRAGTIFEWPYLSGLFAALIAAPLFQTVRDEGAWRFPYPRLHNHAWTDAVIGAASLAFTGVVFLLATLIGGLFATIGIEAVRKLLEKAWFGWMLSGFAFGAAVGLLRERERLLGMLRRLVMIVYSVLAPVLAVALVAFLASIPFTGLGRLWDSGVPATPLMLVAGAAAILLANSVIGDGEDDRSANAILNWSALALVVVILPLAAIAAYSLGIRISQYGWTPERIWGAVAVAIAIGYGIAGWYAVGRGRRDFDEPLRPIQIGLAIGLCGLALFLALPILDFGAISARSQMARLDSGKVEPAKFDWTAMAFKFGPAGRYRLQQIARSGSPGTRDLAQAALNSKSIYSTDTVVEQAQNDRTLDARVRVLSPGLELTPALRHRLSEPYDGCGDQPCVLLRIDDKRLLLIAKEDAKQPVQAQIIDVADLAKEEADAVAVDTPGEERSVDRVDLSKAKVEIRPIQRRQAFVDGKPVGEPF